MKVGRRNATFSESVPVTVPVGAVVLPSPSSTDDHGGRGADDATSTAARSTAAPSGAPSASADDHGLGVEPGDDSGGHGGRAASGSGGSGNSGGSGGSGGGSGRGGADDLPGHG